MDAFESFEHAGFTVELHQDWDPPAPSENDELGEMVSFSALWGNYRFGENGQTPGRESTQQEDDAYERGGWPLLERYLLSAVGYVAAVPFTFHDYGSSGAMLYADDGARHDYGIAGFICTTADRVEELGAPRDDVGRQLRGELKNWGAYVAGEVCGYVIRDEKGEVLDSCWGFYPDDGPGDGLDYLRLEARNAAESERDAREAKRRATINGWALAHRAVTA